MADNNQNAAQGNNDYYNNSQAPMNNNTNYQQQMEYGTGNQQYYSQQYQQDYDMQQQQQQYGDYYDNYYEDYGGKNNYEQDDYDNLDEIDRELMKAGLGSSSNDSALDEFEKEIEANSKAHTGAKSGAFIPAGAMPQQNGVLSPHAAEFWFPESRNCECCKGFKHGCSCRGPGVDTCTKPNCTNPDGAAVAPTSDPTTTDANAPPPAPKTATETAAPAATAVVVPPLAVSMPPQTYNPSGNSGGGGDFCKFESSPQGCRFGASCRFKHRGTAAASPSSKASKCIYFQQGNCQYGATCRFSHD